MYRVAAACDTVCIWMSCTGSCLSKLVLNGLTWHLDDYFGRLCKLWAISLLGKHRVTSAGSYTQSDSFLSLSSLLEIHKANTASFSTCSCLPLLCCSSNIRHIELDPETWIESLEIMSQNSPLVVLSPCTITVTHLMKIKKNGTREVGRWLWLNPTICIRSHPPPPTTCPSPKTSQHIRTVLQLGTKYSSTQAFESDISDTKHINIGITQASTQI